MLVQYECEVLDPAIAQSAGDAGSHCTKTTAKVDVWSACKRHSRGVETVRVCGQADLCGTLISRSSMRSSHNAKFRASASVDFPARYSFDRLLWLLSSSEESNSRTDSATRL
jgi:hypothetical protein